MKIGKKTLRRVIREELDLARLTGSRLTTQRLRDAIRQRGIITEETPVPGREEIGDSLDAQVDRYLHDYEYEAKMTQTEGLDWHRQMRRLMLEAPPEEEEAPEEEPAPEGEEGEEAPEGPPPEPPKLSVNDIDVEAFVNGVIRLIDNYDALLEVRSTLARRAVNFIGKQYDEQVVKMVLKAMREQHGLVPGQTKDEVEAEEFAAPRAGHAGPGGGSM